MFCSTQILAAGYAVSFRLVKCIEYLEGVQNDKQEVQAGPGQAGGPVRAAAVKWLVPNLHIRPY